MKQLILVETAVASQDAEEVERLITIPLERVLSDLKGVALTESSSLPGVSRVTVTYAEKPDPEEIRQIESALAAAWKNFSALAAKPILSVRSSPVP